MGPKEKVYLRGMPQRWYFLLRAPLDEEEKKSIRRADSESPARMAYPWKAN
jgi:hypothetical protein